MVTEREILNVISVFPVASVVKDPIDLVNKAIVSITCRTIACICPEASPNPRTNI